MCWLVARSRVLFSSLLATKGRIANSVSTELTIKRLELPRVGSRFQVSLVGTHHFGLLYTLLSVGLYMNSYASLWSEESTLIAFTAGRVVLFSISLACLTLSHAPRSFTFAVFIHCYRIVCLLLPILDRRSLTWIESHSTFTLR